jgi:hypothetical protein
MHRIDDIAWQFVMVAARYGHVALIESCMSRELALHCTIETIG